MMASTKQDNSFLDIVHIVVHGIMFIARGSDHGIMSLTRFPANGRIMLARRSEYWLNDILPCAVC